MSEIYCAKNTDKNEKCPRCGDLFYDPKSLIESESQRAAEWEEYAKQKERALDIRFDLIMSHGQEISRLKHDNARLVECVNDALRFTELPTNGNLKLESVDQWEARA